MAQRSMVFYAWGGFLVQFLFGLCAVIFVFAGSSHQRAQIEALNDTMQPMQLANLAMGSDFVDVQRALRGYQLTGQDRFLQSYYAGQDQFVSSLKQARGLAWPALLGGVIRQADTAATAFRLGDEALALPSASARADALTNQITALGDQFATQNDQIAAEIARQDNVLARASERTLGVGTGWTAAVLMTALAIPVVIAVASLQRSLVPLRAITNTVRRLAAADYSARAVPGGPRDVRELAESVNLMADEGDRLRAGERERARLHERAREASIRIREHLDADAITHEAVTSIKQTLASDLALVALIRDGKLTISSTNPQREPISPDVRASVPANFMSWIEEIYLKRSSYCLQDLHGAEAVEILAPIREAITGVGATSLLITPFGRRTEVLGTLVLMRCDPRKPWTGAEIAAVESLAADVGRGLTHADMYETEKQLVEKLKFLDRAKSDFLATVSHELRTPLTSITGYVEILKEQDAGPLTTAQATMLGTIEKNTTRLADLIEDVLTISKIESGTFKTVLQPVNLAEVVAIAAETIRPAAAEKGVTLEAIASEPDLVVDGDPNQLDRVLMNLLSNAVKYTPKGGHITLAADRDTGGAVMTVRDTGIGIPAEDQHAMFTRFFRGSNAVALSIPGTGLGLSIVRAIVTNHHGDVELSSTEHVGTIVTVRLPVRRDAGGAPVVQHGRAAFRPAGAGSAGAGPAGAGPAGARSAGAGPAGARSAGARSAGAGPAGARSAGAGPAGARSAGAGPAGAGSAGAGSAGASPRRGSAR
jgi:signal transduction histidine kinase/CHASE3 domain sensor protein